ncbi:hypothetical protein PVAP13_1KG259200 [Panicum virgatum]|uniref:Uncharacterized protein n=1 Tax=Panicum virgatum TaxID=38727 RepID=A0A8T0XFZ8_PANVG|nr:hypothetical protein PVAP13_1KG259200 [Panicum virgatum]
MTTTYTYKLTSIEICIYFDIDLLTCFMQFMAALRGFHSPMLGAVESERGGADHHGDEKKITVFQELN